MVAVQSWLKETIPPILAVIALDLAVTAVFVLVSGKSVRIGTIRSAQTIPPKLLELLAVGLAVGVLANLGRKPDASLVALGVAFVAMIDLDHLPSAMGVAQPIRPTHTIAFVAAEAALLLLLFSKRPEVALLAVASFLGHMAGDVGSFAPFAPFSFRYVSLSAYDVPLAIGAVALALLAGYAKRRRTGGELSSTVNRPENRTPMA